MQRAGSVDNMYSRFPLPNSVKVRTLYSRPSCRYPSLSTFVSPSGSSGSLISSSTTSNMLPSLSIGTWVACEGPPFGFPQRPYPLPLPRNPPLLFGVPVSDGASFLSSSEPRFLFLGGLPSLRLRGRRVEERAERRGVADREGVAESRAGVAPSSASSASSSSSSFPSCSSSSSRGVATLDGGTSAISSSELSDRFGIGVPVIVSTNLRREQAGLRTQRGCGSLRSQSWPSRHLRLCYLSLITAHGDVR